MLAVVTSCEHKEIVYPVSEEINIVFEWDNAPNSGVDGMTLLFYPLESDEGIWRFDISGRGGGPVKIPSGTYELIAFNNDLPGISIGAAGSPSTLYASARSMEPDNKYDSYVSTGMLYCGKVIRLEVTPCGVRYVSSTGAIKECCRNTVRCQPDSVATVYTVNLTHVSGVERIRSAAVALKGVRSSILLESGCPSDAPATLAIDMTKGPGTDDISGRGCAFAPSEPMAADFRLGLQIKLVDGMTILCDIEIKPENLNIITRHNVVINMDGIVIPDGGTSGDVGDIGATVEGWEVIEIDIEPSL